MSKITQRHFDALDMAAKQSEDPFRAEYLSELPTLIRELQAESEALRAREEDLHFSICSAVSEFNAVMFPVDAAFKVKDILRTALVEYADAALSATPPQAPAVPDKWQKIAKRISAGEDEWFVLLDYGYVSHNLRAAEGEEAEIARDAVRYQYLRSKDFGTIKEGGIFVGRTPDNIVINGDDLDAAVDAAIRDAIAPHLYTSTPDHGDE